ncbi:snRNA-activating protein complex subunit 3-like [Mytilus trossulus]|uniref:snRNA-activating protein complex subunit 3-like n=1 Tax=Mytilus trossulus TaxID=6551 RepID=UPI003006AED5
MEAGQGHIRGATELINIREFIQKWDSSVIPGISEADKVYTPMRDVLARELEVERQTIAELESVCNANNLLCGEEKTDISMLSCIPESVDLVSVRMQKRELERREADKIYKTTVLRRLKYSSLDEKNSSALYHDRKPREDLGEYEMDLPNVIINIRVYPPFKFLKMQNAHNKIMPDLNFNVLGTQKLSDLRDKISCVNDLAIAHDLSDNPDNEFMPYAKDVYKSGFFYIEGVFYNDMRYPECQDYGSSIMQWASQPGRKIGEMRTEKMEESLFLNLNVRLGQPYCYMHQGDCEHLIIFTDIRLLNPDDSLDIREYPRLMKKKRVTRTLCRACMMHSARWIVYNSEHAPENPCFFCDQCFKSFHYDEHGKKIGNIKAYKYFDQSAAINL